MVIGTLNERGNELLASLGSLAVLVRTRLWAQILVSMAAGLVIGLALSPQGGGWASEETGYAIASWLRLPGAIFLNLIQMVVVTLVMSSIVLGIASSGDPAYLRRVGLRIFPYFVGTTLVAVAIGALLALSIVPGSYIDTSLLATADAHTPSAYQASDPRPLPEVIADLIPRNIDRARTAGDMLQIVIYAIIAGVAIVATPAARTAKLLDLVEVVQDIALKVVSWAMLLAPLAVFGLLADIAIRVGLDAILGMSVYVGTVLLGLLLLLGFYVLVAVVLGRRGPLEFLSKIREVQLLAFSTSSSAAVMPLSMQVAQQSLQVKPAVAKFIVPLGATVNMDGTALYQVVAAIFLAQVYGIDLTGGQLVLLTATTVGASIGSPSTPGVGIVILATLLQDIGVPASGVALIIGVDRLLDMCRTAVNVSGDLTASVVMDRWLGADSKPAQEPGQRGLEPG